MPTRGRERPGHKEGLPGSADGLAEVQAFEGLIGDFGDDLEVLVQVQDKSAPRVTRTADEETRRPAHGHCWVLTDARHGDLRSLRGRVSRSVIAFLEAADHD